ncbi:MAG: alpha/beta hydrolase [Pseudomonadota bacterium]
MPETRANGITIAYEQYGDGQEAPIVLLQGLSMPLNAWPPAFIDRLTDAGHPVLVMDNRDIGKSETFHQFGIPNLAWQVVKDRVGLPVARAYSLADMAADVNGLMASLGLASAHVAGVSMGGMIAQTLAIRFPARVRSLTSIMSTTGNRRLPKPSSEITRLMLSRPSTADNDARIAHSMKLWRLISSKGFGVDYDLVEKRLRDMYARGVSRGGVIRQMLAIGTAKSRVKALRKLDVPTLVIHGSEDPLVPPAGGVDTADAIPNAKLEIIEGMGHALAPGLIDRLTGLLLDHVAEVERSPRAAA